MKKRGFLSVVLFCFLMIAPFAAASPVDDIARGLEAFTTGIQPVAELLFGGASSNDLLFAKVLFFVIILTLIWVILDRTSFFNEYTWVTWTLAIAVAVLSTRWFADASFIQTLILPYTALGVAISAGLPFLLFFFMVNVGLKEHPRMVRRIAWIFFAVIFVGLWFSRYSELGRFGWIYPVTAGLALLVAWRDGTIRSFIEQATNQKFQSQAARDGIIVCRRIIHQANLDLQAGVITHAEHQKILRDTQKIIKNYTKQL